MDQRLDNFNISSQSFVPAAHQQASTPVYLCPEIWREVAVVATVDLVRTLRQVAPEMRAALDSLAQADLNRINERSNSQFDLYASDGEVSMVTRTPLDRQAIAGDANTSPALQRFFGQS